jgi:GNAT superfamily N-acetyltransferase
MDISHLRFKVVSDNQKKIDIDIKDKKWMLNIEPYDAFTSFIHIDILGKINNTKKFVEVGALQGRCFKVGKTINKHAAVFDIFDSIDQETSRAFEALADEDGDLNDDYVGLGLNVFFIERFLIEEEFRNQGIGEKVLDLLDDILNYFLNCEVGGYILLPNPIVRKGKYEFETFEDESLNKQLKKKLMKFYRKCGYKKIPNTEYMYLNNDYIKAKRDFDVL